MTSALSPRDIEMRAVFDVAVRHQSVPRIAQFFGRDHSTVTYAFRKLNHYHPGPHPSRRPSLGHVLQDAPSVDAYTDQHM